MSCRLQLLAAVQLSFADFTVPYWSYALRVNATSLPDTEVLQEAYIESHELAALSSQYMFQSFVDSSGNRWAASAATTHPCVAVSVCLFYRVITHATSA